MLYFSTSKTLLLYANASKTLLLYASASETLFFYARESNAPNPNPNTGHIQGIQCFSPLRQRHFCFMLMHQRHFCFTPMRQRHFCFMSMHQRHFCFTPGNPMLQSLTLGHWHLTLTPMYRSHIHLHLTHQHNTFFLYYFLSTFQT